jgi:hypothetical protein
LRKKRTRKIGRSAGLSKESAGKAIKPDAAAGPMKEPERDHIRLRGVGYRQYRKLAAASQAGEKPGNC